MSLFATSVIPPETDDNWPNYSTFNPGPPKHLHAIGVLASCFNAFERILFDLYRHHLDRKKVPHKISSQLYFARDERRRLDLIKETFEEFEKTRRVKTLMNNLVEFFTWCYDTRNILLHAEVYPALLSDKILLNIVKRTGRRTTELGYQSFGLTHLRYYANRMEEGRLQAAKIAVHLRYRDTKPAKRSAMLKAYGLEPLPQILVVPDSIELLPRPHSGPLPPLRPQSSPQKPKRARRRRRTAPA